MNRYRSARFGVSILALLVIGLTATAVDAQLVAVSGKDSNPPDEFAFVALSNIPNTTQIFFSNQEWDNTTGQFLSDGEGTIVFTATALISQGTVTRIEETASNTFAVTGSGTVALVVGSSDWSPTAADPHYAFTASNSASPTTTVTEIYALVFTVTGGMPASADPTTGTNNSPNAVVASFSTQYTGVDFNGDRSTATVNDLKNTANYTTAIGPTNLTLDLTSFSAVPVELQEFAIE